jgi:phage shock protein PspC (stress-responsive transcriptional regulator)
MNKTVTINISGIIFHIEEDAYQNLNAYLTALKGRFSRDESGAEILADIEARIAELMQQKLNPAKQVLLNSDVEAVMATMGKPEDLGEQASQEGEVPPPRQTQLKRRFFRDPDDKVIGGVCSGLAAYFDIDRVWVRLAMFLLIFFGGLSLWVYVILWIIIPQARSTADKLAMRGQPANINNIFKNFKEEAEDVKSRFSRYGNEINRNYGDRIRDNAGHALSSFFGILGRFIGLIILLIGGCMLIGYAAVITGVSLVDLNPEVSNWKTAIFASSGDYTLAVIAFIIAAGVPIFLLLYAGTKLMFRIRYSNRWLMLGLGLTWVLGIILTVYVSVKTAQQFNENARLKEEIELADAGDTIRVTMRYTPEYYPTDSDDDDHKPSRHGKIKLTSQDKHIRIVGSPGLDILESHDGKSALQVHYSSKGPDKRTAYINAKAIKYHFERKGNQLVFDENFVIEDNIKFRQPHVELKLHIPVGTVVFLDRSVKGLLDDVDNISNTWEGDMAGRRWKMTEKGLECIDCDNLKEHPYDDWRWRHKHTSHVDISEEGIHVKDKDEEVTIDEHGIHVRSREEKPEKK